MSMESNSRIVGDKYKLGRKIGSGSFGQIFLAAHVDTHEIVDVKMENRQTKHQQLLYEARLYNYLQGVSGVASIHWSGVNNRRLISSRIILFLLTVVKEIPLFPIYIATRRRVFYGPIRMMGPSTSSNSEAGSVKPLAASSLCRFDNTLPSKARFAWNEGIDELSEFYGAGKAVAEWTARAMGGSVPFEEALAARLSLFKPSSSTVQPSRSFFRRIPQEQV